jgi:arylsulfatase A-like enzyme
MTSENSVLLITVDCLRADHTGFMGYQRPTTPFLDSLAGESFVFPAATVAGAPTYYSFPSILASRYPLAMGRDQIGIAPGERNLATVLKDAGYATGAFCAGNPYLSSRFGYDQGFDTFQDFLGADAGGLHDSASAPSPNGGWATRINRTLDRFSHQFGPLGAVYDELYFQYCQRWATSAPRSLDELRRFPAAHVIVDHAVAWLRSIGDAPFFLWLHFMDPHSPYYPTEAALASMGEPAITPFRARYLNSIWNRSDLSPERFAPWREEIVRLYDAGIRWVDTQVSRLADALRQLNRWDRCGLAFTADHGEEFLDHGGRYHPPHRLMEELIRVPLLLRIPHAGERRMGESPFSLVHLAPTLLEAVKVPPPESFRGRSFWAQIRDGNVWEEQALAESVAGCTNPFRPDNRLGARVLAVREARYKLMLHFDTPREALYDLEADPQERSPLPPGAEKGVRRRLLEKASEHLARESSGTDIQARLRLRLRELQLDWGSPPKQKRLLRSSGEGV